jgi:PHD/YefM family antitoxin component YafN of YafNO toxin-antitoxin module
MVKKISVKEAQSLLPQLTQNLDTHDSFVIESDGQLRLAILSAEEYARFKTWERREVIRSRIFNEMEGRRSRSNWTEAFKLMESLSQRAQVSDDDLHRLVDNAVSWARTS